MKGKGEKIKRQETILLDATTVDSVLYQILVARMGKKINAMKSERCEGRWCEKHHFSIRPLFVMINNPKECSIRLCPRFNREKKTFESVMPMFNPDHKYYTPLFILEQDQKLYVDHDRSNLRNFENSRLAEEYQISQIVTFLSIIPRNSGFFSSLIMQMLPKVGSGNNHCKVCRDQYPDYLQHIQSDKHRQQLARNPCTAFIGELVDNFKPTHFEQKKQNVDCLPHPLTSQLMEEEEESQLMEKETSLRMKESPTDKQESELKF